MEPEWESLEQAVGESLGAASVCWEDMSGTGVFQSDKAHAALDRLLAYIHENYEKKPAADEQADL